MVRKWLWWWWMKTVRTLNLSSRGQDACQCQCVPKGSFLDWKTMVKTRERLCTCKWGLCSSDAVDAWVQVILCCVLPSGKFQSPTALCLLEARGNSFLDVTARNVFTYLRKTPVWAPSLGGETVVYVFSHKSRADPMHNRWLHEAELEAPSDTDVAKIND